MKLWQKKSQGITSLDLKVYYKAIVIKQYGIGIKIYKQKNEYIWELRKKHISMSNLMVLGKLDNYI